MELGANTFYHGDCLFVLTHDIPAESVDLVYLDPPFFTGKIQKGKWQPGAMEISFVDSKEFWAEKGISELAPEWIKHVAVKRPAFASYLCYMMERLQACHKALKKTGSIYLHCDWRASHYLKMVMDEIFGEDNFQNEIVWAYKTQGASKKRFARKHDTILFYSKTDKWKFNTQYEKSFMMHKYGFKGSDFKIYPETGQQYNVVISKDIWEISALQSATSEKTGFPTQKPEALLERIIKASSNERDWVLDPFCGCGTTVIVAHKLNRRWIGVDIDTSDREKGELPTAFRVIKNRSGELFEQSRYVSRDLREIEEMGSGDFEKWVNEFYGATKPMPDAGVDGITKDGLPIQAKTGEVSYGTVSQFLSDAQLHTKVPQPVKQMVIVSQTGFDDSARKRVFEIKTKFVIEIQLKQPKDLLKIG